MQFPEKWFGFVYGSIHEVNGESSPDYGRQSVNLYQFMKSNASFERRILGLFLLKTVDLPCLYTTDQIG